MVIYANETNSGVITWLNSGFDPCICIKKCGRWRWEKFKDLSGANFRKYKQSITTQLNKLLSENRTSVKIKYQPHPDEYKLLKELFDKLKDEEKKQLITKYKNTDIGKSICGTCLKYSLQNKTKCIHFDCPGQCLACFNKMGENFKTCTACNKKQEMECPICTEVYNAKHLTHFSCRHCVCWQCYCRSYISNKPLKKCPLCRKTIKK